jgi:hypothetical protein
MPSREGYALLGYGDYLRSQGHQARSGVADGPVRGRAPGPEVLLKVAHPTDESLSA